mgnify:CR=1 FL=1
MMSSLPPVNDVKAAIANLDEDVLSREQLEKIRANIATPEEMEQINALDGPHVKWDKPEQFLKVIMNIPKVTRGLDTFTVSTMMCIVTISPSPPAAGPHAFAVLVHQVWFWREVRRGRRAAENSL